MAQDLRNKESTQERGEGNSQAKDEEKCKDFHQTGPGEELVSQEPEDRVQEKYRTYRLPDTFECIARCLDLSVG